MVLCLLWWWYKYWTGQRVVYIQYINNYKARPKPVYKPRPQINYNTTNNYVNRTPQTYYTVYKKNLDQATVNAKIWKDKYDKEKIVKANKKRTINQQLETIKK